MAKLKPQKIEKSFKNRQIENLKNQETEKSEIQFWFFYKNLSV